MPASRQVVPADPEAGSAQQLVDHVLVALVQLGFRVPDRGREAAEDLAVRERLTRRVGCFHLRRKGVVEVGADEVVRLEEAGGREHVVGQVGSVGLEEVEYDREQILALERPP